MVGPNPIRQMPKKIPHAVWLNVRDVTNSESYGRLAGSSSAFRSSTHHGSEGLSPTVRICFTPTRRSSAAGDGACLPKHRPLGPFGGRGEGELAKHAGAGGGRGGGLWGSERPIGTIKGLATNWNSSCPIEVVQSKLSKPLDNHIRIRPTGTPLDNLENGRRFWTT